MRIGSTPRAWKLLSRTVDRIRTLRVLLIVTFRPEFEPPWIGRPYVTALTINRLGEREIAAMIDRVTGNKPLPASIRQDIIERTDGIPLFVEEMTKAVLEAESEKRCGAHGRRHSIPGSGRPRKPARLADGAARPARPGQGSGTDRRGDRAGVLSCSVGCGGRASRRRNFSRRSTVSLTAGLLFRQGVPPHATYLFKHALGAGRGLRHTTARAATRASRSYRRNP